MALTVLQLWNRAISALGSEATVAAENEVSREAELCSIWYESVRDLVFSAAPWPGLTGHFRLATLAVRDTDADWVSTDPDPGWAYAFSLPNDYSRARYLTSGGRFIMSALGNAQALMANEETPILSYTRKVTNPTLWNDSGLEHAIIYALAAHIAKPLTGNDSDLSNMFMLAEQKVLAARAMNANMQNNPVQSLPEWITARGQGVNTQFNRFFYPSADFVMMTGAPLG